MTVRFRFSNEGNFSQRREETNLIHELFLPNCCNSISSQLSGTKVWRFEFGAMSSAWHAAVDRQESHEWLTVCSRRNRARVCVRVRTRARDTGPGSRPTYDIELHRGQGAKKLFPLSFHSPLPPRERPISPSKEEKIARARVSFCSSTNRRD